MPEDIPREFISHGRFVCLRDLEGTRDALHAEIESVRREIDLHFKLLEKAISKAEDTMEHRLSGMNEVRAQLNSQAATFLTKDRFDQLHTEFGKRIEILENKMSNLQGKILATGGVVAVVLAIIETVLHFIPTSGK